MTTTAFLREQLGEPALRRSVAEIVRRGVPASEVEDLSQTVLCDALAAAGAPGDPVELRRWLAAIARHKIADWHRRGGRLAPLEDEPGAAPAPVVETRELLVRVDRGVATARDRETLEWLLREHAGEPLADIARSAGVAPPAVRQRVSRLRRALRTKWTHALVVLGALGGVAALARHVTPPRAESIAADPQGDRAAQLLALVQGRWRVAWAAPADASEADRLLLSAAEVEVRGTTITIVTPARAIVREATIGAREDGTLAVVLHDAAGATQAAEIRLSGGDLVVTLGPGRLEGRARLTR